MVNMGRGREDDRVDPGAVAPEQNRALGRYVAIWTTNPDSLIDCIINAYNLKVMVCVQ
jgi:hypothetical protein